MQETILGSVSRVGAKLVWLPLMALVSLAAIPSIALAQDDAGNGRVLSWSELGERPDFTTGVWEIPMTAEAFDMSSPQFTAPYAAQMRLLAEQEFRETGSASCIPPGMPGVMYNPYPMQIMFGPAEVMIQLEAMMQIRHVYTDGRTHPEELNPTFNGHSTGHWDGDTLVIETVGFVDDTPLDPSWELYHSDKMTIVERFRLIAPDTLEMEMTVSDPEAFLEPWVRRTLFTRHAEWEIAEYICQQNNRNGADANGNAIIDLTPPPEASE